MTTGHARPAASGSQIARRGVIAGFASLIALPATAQENGQAAANKATIRRLLEGVQQGGDFALFERLFAEDYVDHTPFGGFAPNRDGTREIYQAFRIAFPDWRAEVHFQIAEGDLVSTYKTYHGTHRGPFMGIAPTGRTTRFDVMDIMRVRDGRITDHWTVADGAGLIAQLRG